MEFGPEIKVDGKRPEWLKDDEVIDIRWSDGPWFSIEDRAGVHVRHIHWSCSTGIRLPANHPHYATPTPGERAVAPELVARLVDLAKSLAIGMTSTKLVSDARAIVAALEPVDPILLEARQVVADLYTGGNVSYLREQALSGDGDEWFHTKVALAAIKRGRQLEKEGK